MMSQFVGYIRANTEIFMDKPKDGKRYIKLLVDIDMSRLKKVKPPKREPDRFIEIKGKLYKICCEAGVYGRSHKCRKQPAI